MSATWISALDGMQPTLRQTPPSRSRSTSVTVRPAAAARSAAEYPPGPPPMTSRSTPVATSPTTIRSRAPGRSVASSSASRATGSASRPVTYSAKAVARSPSIRRWSADSDHGRVGRAFDLAVDDERPGPDGAEPHDPDLGGPDQRGGEPPADGAVVGDRERPAPQFADIDPAVAGGGREPPDLGAEIGQGAPVGLADDRHDEPVGGGHRQPDVAVLVDDDALRRRVAASMQFERGVEQRVAAQAAGDGGHEEGADGGVDAGVGQSPAGGEETGGVDLVEGREVGDLRPRPGHRLGRDPPDPPQRVPPRLHPPEPAADVAEPAFLSSGVGLRSAGRGGAFRACCRPRWRG